MWYTADLESKHVELECCVAKATLKARASQSQCRNCNAFIIGWHFQRLAYAHCNFNRGQQCLDTETFNCTVKLTSSLCTNRISLQELEIANTCQLTADYCKMILRFDMHSTASWPNTCAVTT